MYGSRRCTVATGQSLASLDAAAAAAAGYEVVAAAWLARSAEFRY
jgi:hypothetical protein